MVPLALLSGGSTCVELTLTHAVAPKAALMSAAAFFAYNRLSLSVLLMLDAVSHSVCNALRRAVTIGVAALLFSTKLDAPTITGIVIIICGSTSYALGSARDRAEAAAAEQEEEERTTLKAEGDAEGAVSERRASDVETQ